MTYADCYLRDTLREVGHDLGLQIAASQPSLRERLICAALKGLLAYPKDMPFDDVSRYAIAHADAVIAKLSAEKEHVP